MPGVFAGRCLATPTSSHSDIAAFSHCITLLIKADIKINQMRQKYQNKFTVPSEV
jgi:hypothetical protein